jgi:hypothetical protein
VVSWVVVPSIRLKGNKAVTRRILSLCGPNDPWEGNTSVTQRKHNDSAYYNYCNETHVTDKTNSNAVQLMFLRIQTTEDPS